METVGTGRSRIPGSASAASAAPPSQSRRRNALPDTLWDLVTPVSPHAGQANEHVLAWVRAQGLVGSDGAERRLAAVRLGDFAARVYPTATLDGLLLATDWIAWLDFLDDQNDDRGAQDPQRLEDFLAGIVRITSAGATGTEGRDPATGPIGAALKDLWDRTRTVTGSRLRRRLRLHLMEYFAGNLQQSAYRLRGDVCDLTDYAALRRAAGGVLVTFDLAECIGGAELPPALYYSRTCQRLLAAAGDVVCWTNDVLTVEKEAAAGDLLNLVTVLEADRSCTRGAALVQARDLVGGRLQDFRRSERTLPDLCGALELDPAEREALTSWAGLLRAWMRGHADWGLTTSRYGGPAAGPGRLEDLIPGPGVVRHVSHG
jgi:hypothetical protein